jgi:hypothetical protein
MYITDTWPKKVNGFVVPYDYQDRNRQLKSVRRSDMAAMIALRMDNGAVVKSLHPRVCPSRKSICRTFLNSKKKHSKRGMAVATSL